MAKSGAAHSTNDKLLRTTAVCLSNKKLAETRINLHLSFRDVAQKTLKNNFHHFPVKVTIFNK